jgi:hypothetical protein
VNRPISPCWVPPAESQRLNMLNASVGVIRYPSPTISIPSGEVHAKQTHAITAGDAKDSSSSQGRAPAPTGRAAGARLPATAAKTPPRCVNTCLRGAAGGRHGGGIPHRRCYIPFLHRSHLKRAISVGNSRHWVSSWGAASYRRVPWRAAGRWRDPQVTAAS